MIAIDANILSKSVSQQFLVRIEELVADADYQDALSQLQDYSSNFWPSAKKEILLIRARYNRWRTAQRQGVTSTENINDISSAILEACEAIHSNSVTPKQFQFDDKDLSLAQGATAMAMPMYGAMLASAASTAPVSNTSLPVDVMPSIENLDQAINLEKVQKQHWQVYNRIKGLPVCKLESVAKNFGKGAFRLQ